MTANQKWRMNNLAHARKLDKVNCKKYRQRHKDKIKKYSEFVQRRKLSKIIGLKKELGDKCSICGFDDIRILQFHHLSDKKFTISSKAYQSLDKLRVETKKCVLVCPNCHAIIHLKNKDIL